MGGRAFAEIGDLEGGSESAWPAAESQSWRPCESDKVRLFVLVYLLSVGDLLPAISGLPLKRKWVAAVKSVGTEGAFKRSLFVQENEAWTAAVAYQQVHQNPSRLGPSYKHEADFARGERSAANILEYVHCNVENYIITSRSSASLSLGLGSAARGQQQPVPDLSCCASRASGPTP